MDKELREWALDWDRTLKARNKFEPVNKRRMYRKVVMDIRTGRVVDQVGFTHQGPMSWLMPSVRPGKMKSWPELEAAVTPRLPGNVAGERIPWTWYHRRAYTSGTTTTLTFFDATGVPTTTNMEAARQIPAPTYFDIYHFGIYYDIDVSTLNAAGVLTVQGGALNDVVNLSDGIATLNISQKVYHRTMQWLCPAGAGAYGQLAAAGTFTAEDYNIFQQGTLGVPDLRNRNCLWGDITIPHNQSFDAVLDWAAAVTLDNGNTDIIPYLDGYYYRRVL